MLKASPGVRWPRTPRNLHRSLRFFALSLLTLLVPAAIWAHTDPPGSTQTGVSLTLTAFRSDGVTPVLPGSVSQCGETIIYRGTLAWAGTPTAAIQGGTLTITTPDLVMHNVTPVGGIPCLGGTTAPCTPGVTSINSQNQSFTVGPATPCSPGANLVASIAYANGTAHLGPNDTPGVSGTTPLQIPLQCCPTPTPTNTPTNTPTLTNTPVNTPTNTPTNTPVNTPTNTPPPSAPPPVPTLSFPMMALLGLLLAGAGLFLARRH